MTRKPDHISQEAWDAVESPELTSEELARLRPAREVMPGEIFAKLTKARGPQKTPTKEAVSLRLDRDVLDHFRATGSGWQTKINDVLRESAHAEARTAARVARSASTGAFVSKAQAVRMPKNATKELASSVLKNPAKASPDDIRKITSSALTQRSRLSPATRRDKHRSK